MTLIRPTRRMALALGLASAAGLAWPLAAQETGTDGAAPAAADTAAPREVKEMAMGAEDAPVTVIEYASLTCPHCARFHNEVFGKLKANYIETGKIRFIVRDVYFDRLGLWAAMVARCEGGSRYFGITDRLFSKQADWAHQKDPQEALTAIFAIGRQAGLTNDQMGACVQDQAWAEKLVAAFQKNVEADDVQGTPTFFIDGKKEGNMGYDAFAQKLDAALGS